VRPRPATRLTAQPWEVMGTRRRYLLIAFLRDLTEVHWNVGKHGAKARRKIAGAKCNNYGILRSPRRYRLEQDLRDAPRYRIMSVSRPFLSWTVKGAERIGSE
ncbi:MAG: hypothetical protein ACREYF_24015, partial [Gammaproteobacteria bacterium]